MDNCSFEIELVACLKDNYAVLLYDHDTRRTILVDAPEFTPIDKALKIKNRQLTDILITHHHWDHIQALDKLKQAYHCQIWGPEREADKIGLLDQVLSPIREITIANHTIRILSTPGHTLGHICYYFADQNLIFTGDTLLVMGCGRLFEGTPEAMQRSLHQIAGLPDQTAIYCGHEYALSNGRFALTVEPGNNELIARMKQVKANCDQGVPVMPTTVGLEKRTNPFFRLDSPEIRRTLHLQQPAKGLSVFARLRELKDNF